MYLVLPLKGTEILEWEHLQLEELAQMWSILPSKVEHTHNWLPRRHIMYINYYLCIYGTLLLFSYNYLLIINYIVSYFLQAYTYNIWYSQYRNFYTAVFTYILIQSLLFPTYSYCNLAKYIFCCSVIPML